MVDVTSDTYERNTAVSRSFGITVRSLGFFGEGLARRDVRFQYELNFTTESLRMIIRTSDPVAMGPDDSSEGSVVKFCSY